MSEDNKTPGVSSNSELSDGSATPSGDNALGESEHVSTYSPPFAPLRKLGVTMGNEGPEATCSDPVAPRRDVRSEAQEDNAELAKPPMFVGTVDELEEFINAGGVHYVPTQITEKLNLKAAEPPWQGCDVPPPGWWCSRAKGHEVPCAARPGAPPREAERGAMMDGDWPLPPGAPVDTARLDAIEANPLSDHKPVWETCSRESAEARIAELEASMGYGGRASLGAARLIANYKRRLKQLDAEPGAPLEEASRWQLKDGYAAPKWEGGVWWKAGPWKSEPTRQEASEWFSYWSQLRRPMSADGRARLDVIQAGLAAFDYLPDLVAPPKEWVAVREHAQVFKTEITPKPLEMPITKLFNLDAKYIPGKYEDKPNDHCPPLLAPSEMKDDEEQPLMVKEIIETRMKNGWIQRLTIGHHDGCRKRYPCDCMPTKVSDIITPREQPKYESPFVNVPASFKSSWDTIGALREGVVLEPGGRVNAGAWWQKVPSEHRGPLMVIVEEAAEAFVGQNATKNNLEQLIYAIYGRVSRYLSDERRGRGNREFRREVLGVFVPADETDKKKR